MTEIFGKTYENENQFGARRMSNSNGYQFDQRERSSETDPAYYIAALPGFGR